ncbi:membrane protein insertase YidC [Sphingomonas canadensis]|uniref:Membrane protein insertase YidC n=1 Tax=Sphingomonas canadensis TaxID=1219257 RepID=A0ABW3H3Z7_9SPHN|nr:membrane protein insertase YidC [Sphingomonas canadensis]MCW3835442.1 membrane protein insertase YidC [Sphingomonas canadensis]
MKEDQKNLVIFAVLAALILFAWGPLTHWLAPQPAKPPVTASATPKPGTAATPGSAPSAADTTPLRDRTEVLAASAGERVVIDTPKLKGSINLKGLRFDDLELARYDETVKKNSPPIRLLSPSGAETAYFAEFGWLGPNVQLPGRDTLWQASAKRLAPGSPVTLTATNASGQRFRTEIAVDADYMFTIRQTVENPTGSAISLTPYARLNRAERSRDIDQWAAHVGPMAVANGAANYIDYNEVDKGEKSFDTQGGWAGFTDHYWLTALIPAQGAQVTLKQLATADKRYQAEYAVKEAFDVAPGKAITYTSRFFAGAKEVKLLDAYQEQLGISHLNRAIDWGWFEIIEIPIFYYLDWLFRLVGNFGVAIVLLTITIRALLFPVAHKQFQSMANMRAIQPKMKALQERYKDDKPKQQQEIMKLYKEEKVNPLAGCLPILLQIPIMFALYKVLLITIEMRHQPFVLWIRDLSAPDPATILNLFGMLPFTPPSFLAIGVVPVLLGVSMYVQIKLNPAPMDEMQKQIFAFMPWMLMFMMAPFAVGLQVYWITSNVITIAQQWWLYKQHPVLSQKPAK